MHSPHPFPVAALTKGHRLGGPKQQKLTLSQLGGRTSKITMSAGWVPLEDPGGESVPCLSPSVCWFLKVWLFLGHHYLAVFEGEE